MRSLIPSLLLGAAVLVTGCGKKPGSYETLADDGKDMVSKVKDKRFEDADALSPASVSCDGAAYAAALRAGAL